MLFAAVRDMQWRRRRFVIAILSTAIIFAMTLVLTGLANGFRVEAERTVDVLAVDLFLVRTGASGPFVGATPFAPVDLRRVAATPGVVAAAPLVYAGGTVTLGPVFHLPRSATVRARTDAIVVGYTVRTFRERLGVGGVRDLIEHRPLATNEHTDEHQAVGEDP